MPNEKRIAELTPWVPAKYRPTPEEFATLLREVPQPSLFDTQTLREDEGIRNLSIQTGMPHEAMRNFLYNDPRFADKERERVREMTPGQVWQDYNMGAGDMYLGPTPGPGQARDIGYGLQFPMRNTPSERGFSNWTLQEGARATQPIRNIPMPHAVYRSR